jgi:uridine phosphorylase
MPMAAQLHRRWDAWVAGGAICSEMESATIFVLGSILKVRTGGVMHMHAEGTEDADPDRVGLLRTAVEALRILIRDDREGRSWP